MKGLDSYINAVKARLNSKEVKQKIQFAQCDPKYTSALVNDGEAYNQVADAILTSASNMYQACQGRDAVAAMVSNFSEGYAAGNGVGYNDVANVNTIGAIDVTLLARAESLIPYIAVDRALPTPDATVYFQNLVAMNNAGGFTQGEIVNGSYVPPATKTELGGETIGTYDNGAFPAFGKIVPGSVKITLGTGSAAVEGQDFARDGKIYFAGTDAAITVDYKTGAVTVASGSIPAGSTIQAQRDDNGDVFGQNILRVAPSYTNVQLNSKPQNIILENNMLSQMYMNKTYTLASGRTDAPYNDTIFTRVKNTYVEYLNKLALVPLVANTLTPMIDMDLSKYALNDFAYTKNDMIGQIINNICAKMLANTGVGCTALVTNSYGAALLMNIPNLFVAAPDANKGLNGLVGYWQGMPVYRHNYLDYAYGYNPTTGTGATAEFIGVYKDPNNNAGSEVYGEFLPFTSTGLVGNFFNPSQIANGYFSQVAVKVVQSNLFVRAKVTVPTITAGSALNF